MRRVIILSAAALISISVAGCADTEPGEALPNGNSSQSSAAPSNSLSFPSELDVGSYMDRPCDVLSPELLESRGYPIEGQKLEETGPAGQRLSELTGPSCSWGAKETTHAQVLSVSLIDQPSRGSEAVLNGVRERHRSGVLQLWEEVEVAGYPAAYYGLRDNRDRGDCAMMVAVSGTAIVTVNAGPYMDDPRQACVDVDEFVADLIGNLQKGA